MSSAQAALLIAEKRRRDTARVGLLEAAFKEQRAFIEDPSRFKAAKCTRRAGKSFGIGLYLFREGLLNPGVNCLYLARTRQSAKDMMLKDVFREINDRFQLGARYNFADLTITLPNGSVIHIAGADANAAQMHKVVGKKYRLIVIDECQYWSNNLWRLIYEGLQATMADWGGTICLLGAPSPARAFFYEVSTKARDTHTGEIMHPEWSVHEWSAIDNPHMKAQWLNDIAMIKQNNPRFMLTPTFRQQYLGEWVDDPDARCYRFDDKVNRIDHLPGHVSDYQWLQGIDVGYRPDPMGFVVCGYRKDNTDPCLYVVKTHKQGEMMIDDIARFSNELDAEWPAHGMRIIDGHNTNVYAELSKRLNIPLQPAKHSDKTSFIHLVTDDLMSGKIKLVGDAADDLASEWMKLVWDKSNQARIVPDSACEDHLSDAFLYAWRHAHHYLKPQTFVKPPAKGTEAWAIEFERKLADSMKEPHDAVSALDQFLGPRSSEDGDDLFSGARRR